jgi:xanthosine utilization system XapX-like protein
MKILYKPFAILAGIIGARIGQKAFKALWAKIDDSPPPKATTREASLPKIVGAKALEAATMAGIAAAVDHASAKSFHHLTGIWPGPKPQAEEEQAA